jgi:hypothetical protein
MSLAYKVEELLALRDSVSESAVSIDKFADGDVIKGQYSISTLTFHFTPPLTCCETLHRLNGLSNRRLLECHIFSTILNTQSFILSSC